MSVILINPPIISSKNHYEALTPPMGIAYLAAYLREQKIDVSVIDAPGEKPQNITYFNDQAYLRGMNLEQIVAAIPEEAKLIGISNLFSVAYPVVSKLCWLIRNKMPDVTIVLGGPHPSNYARECLMELPINFVVHGEGELALEQLYRFAQGEIASSELFGVSFRVDGKIVNIPDKRILDLNTSTLPWPARDLLPMENYIFENEGHQVAQGRWTPIITSRGCPFGCTFCASRKTKFIGRDPMDVVDEIEHCLETYGIKEFHFEDDNFTIQRKRVVGICEEIIRRKLNIVWSTPNGIRASVTDKELLTLMKKSGCDSIVLAPESGSRRVLDEIVQKGKSHDLDQLCQVAKDASGLGLKVSAYFVLGMPGETTSDIIQTINYACRLAKNGVTEVGFGLFIPLPGTPHMNDRFCKKIINKKCMRTIELSTSYPRAG